MAAAGLGVRRAPFALDRVTAQAPDGSHLPLFADGHPLAPAAPPPSLPPVTAPGLTTPRATLRLLTPLRLKIRNGLAGTVTFRELVFAMLRRTLELAWFHVPGAEVDWHFRPLLDQADAIRCTPHLTWHDQERYSNRQQTKMLFGGLLGRLDLEGDLTPFVPLLRAAEILHVGKGATFGLGRIAVEGRD